MPFVNARAWYNIAPELVEEWLSSFVGEAFPPSDETSKGLDRAEAEVALGGPSRELR
jgi:hypothetical protein